MSPRRIISSNPDGEFRKLRNSGRASLPRDPVRSRVDNLDRASMARNGSLQDDVADFFGTKGPSEGRELLKNRGYRNISQKNLATAGPEALEAINAMHKQRTASPQGMGGMGNATVAWPKLRDPFEQFREKAWWFLKEGEFSESLRKIREWCNTPEAPIWMANGTFKPIGEITVGEKVMGWEWQQNKSGQWKKHFVASEVIATNRRKAPMIVEVELESGRTMRCTPDHKWANANYSRAMWGDDPRQGRTREYRPATVGMTLNNFINPVEPLTDKKLIEAAAYLGGIIDGEGSVYKGEISIAQSVEHNPNICERIENILDILEIPFRVVDRDGVGRFGSEVRVWTLTGGKQTLAKLRAWVPSFKVEKAWLNCVESRTSSKRDKVASISEIGPGEVVSMQTSTGNYVAWGVASKNCRLVYMTHPLVPSLIDIYARFPLLDIEFKHPDRKLADFYNDLFLNELNYQDFLFDMAKEYWTTGEAFALGSWHEGIGTWDADELINPDDVIVSRNSVLRQYKYHLHVPEGIKKLIETRQPRQEYEMLVKFYPYILQWAQQNQEIPVSDVLLKQLKFKINPWEPHGVPILMRGFKTLMLEMSLEAAQDAVADRLYSPLILANLGIEDVGDGEGPWIPEPEEIDALKDDLALALMSDFRLMVYHHGLDVRSVFGREAMPRFDADFGRVDMKLMGIFGIGPELLQGGNSYAPYASGALNRELLTQMLTTYQISVKRFLRERMAVVAEAQGHYEFEKRGSQRYPVFETVLMVDELTGEEYIEERPKLAIPEPMFRTMNLRDEVTERQFLLELKASGVPISDQALITNIPIVFDEEVTKLQREKMDKVLAELHYQKRLFIAIYMNGLPVPPEYMQSYMQFLMGVQSQGLMFSGTDITNGSPTPNLFPMLQPSALDLNNAMMSQEMMMGEEEENGESSRPASSDEQRASMPKAANLRMYASKEEKEIFDQIGEQAWMEKVGLVESVDFSSEGIDKNEEMPYDPASVDSFTEEIPELPSPEEMSHRIGSIKTLASPEHMKLRRRMKLPKNAKIKEAKYESEFEGIVSPESEGGQLEGPGEMLGENKEPTE